LPFTTRKLGRIVDERRDRAAAPNIESQIMRDSNEIAGRAASDAVTATCRNCNHTLANREYYCPECNSPHFPHLKPALASPMMSMLVFFLIIAGPVAAYTAYVKLMQVAGIP
jgi:hypothetical protein